MQAIHTSLVGDAISILVVDPLRATRSTLAQLLNDAGYDVQSVSGLDAAAQLVADSPPDVLIVGLHHDCQDGLEVVRFLGRQRTPARIIALATCIGDHHEFIRAGAVKVLAPNASLQELRDAIALAMESKTGFWGFVHAVSLVDILQLLHVARRSVRLCLGGPVEASLVISGGELIHAEHSDKLGEEALISILAAQSGSFEMQPLTATPPQRTLAQGFNALLLEILKIADERDNAGLELADDRWADEEAARVAVRRALPNASAWWVGEGGHWRTLDGQLRRPPPLQSEPLDPILRRISPSWQVFESVTQATGRAVFLLNDGSARLIVEEQLSSPRSIGRFRAGVGLLQRYLALWLNTSHGRTLRPERIVHSGRQSVRTPEQPCPSSS